MVQLGANRYGKAEVRVVRVTRGAGPGGVDLVRDWNVGSALSGDLADTHLTGSNTNVLPTDTQKNTIYAFAKSLGGIAPEAFAVALGRHYLDTQEPISRARISIEQYGWNQIPVGGHSFSRNGSEVRTTVVISDREAGPTIVSGIKDLVVLNTTGSEFWGYPRDEYTTLQETKERMLATQVSAQWRYRTADAADLTVDWDAAFAQARESLLTAFASTYSYSLQQTLYAIGEKIITDVPAVSEVRLALPNKHHFLVDLEPFGLENDNEVYYAADRPYGLIEGTMLADDASDPGYAWD